MTTSAEAIGVARAAARAGRPSAISFTVETDGTLPSGESLRDAIDAVDADAAAAGRELPAYFMVNCAHPSHFERVLGSLGERRARLRGLRANASRRSHAELDAATELDAGNPRQLGADYARLSAVQTWEIDDTRHTDGDVDYPHTPPAGGPHAPIWLDCGVYDVPVRDENAVHDLEHGTVWITHDPELSERDLEELAEQLPDNGIMSPREDLPSPVVVTVWGAQLALDGVRDERLGLFLEEYGDGHTAPEFGVTCNGGTPDPTGAVPEPGVGA